MKSERSVTAALEAESSTRAERKDNQKVRWHALAKRAEDLGYWLMELSAPAQTAKNWPLVRRLWSEASRLFGLAEEAKARADSAVITKKKRLSFGYEGPFVAHNWRRSSPREVA